MKQVDDDSEDTYELMERAGLLQNPDTAPYVERDIDLSTDDMIRLLSEVGNLSRRQAEAFVHRRVLEEGRQDAAGALEITTSTLDDYVSDAEEKLSVAGMTVKILHAIDAEDYAPPIT